jgi:uncharacterized protein YwqG
MGLLTKIFRSNEEGKRDVATAIAALFEERAAVDSARARFTRETCAPWESKLGGAPYLPGDFPYPTERREGREEVPLRFLAQLNFEEIPALPGFPSRGLLQFYVGNDEQLGMDHETMTAQKGFRVLFHEEVDRNATPRDVPAMPGGEALVPFPFEGELRACFERERAVMNADDFRFDGLFLQYYNELHPGARLRSLERLPERLLDEVYERFARGGHRVGGYPAFTRLDPRLYHEHLRDHTVLLLQLDSNGTGDHALAWPGACHFLARPDDLASRDFSEVSYSWETDF